jgi:NAD(P)H-dependent flavin oxidoreductase YrpB (nitropropane dioxygenase family)
MFNSKYPIIAAPMNQVSYWEFAAAVHDAGAFPSISGYCYYNSIDSLIYAFEQYVSTTNSSNIIAALDDTQIINAKVVDMLTRLNISHVIRYRNEDSSTSRVNNYEKLALSILNTLPCTTINIHDVDNSNAKIHFLKGNDGAGRPGTEPTKVLFDRARVMYPQYKFVPVGGIGTAEHVKYYIENGAVAVAVGTLLAASQESCLSLGTKQAMVSATSKDLVHLDKNFMQKALPFKKYLEDDDSNHTQSLKNGITTNGTSGHIFSGNGIDYIDGIKSVKEIVTNLSSQIKML